MTGVASGRLATVDDAEVPVALESLERQVDAVRTLTKKFDAAAAAQLRAECRLLENAFLTIAPVRRVLCKPLASEVIDWVATGREQRVTCFPQSGLVLAGGPEEDGGVMDIRGEYQGTSLVLWADGTLAIVRFSGEWTRVEGKVDRLRCKARRVTTRRALQQRKLEDCLATLTKALSEQAEIAKPANAQLARARAAKLAAVATLIGGEAKPGQSW